MSFCIKMSYSSQELADMVLTLQNAVQRLRNTGRVHPTCEDREEDILHLVEKTPPYWM